MLKFEERPLWAALRTLLFAGSTSVTARNDPRDALAGGNLPGSATPASLIAGQGAGSPRTVRHIGIPKGQTCEASLKYDFLGYILDQGSHISLSNGRTAISWRVRPNGRKNTPALGRKWPKPVAWRLTS